MLSRIIFISILFILASCKNEVIRTMEPKASALGKMNEIVVVADDEIWESPAGDTFRYYFESAYPIMPQPEPLFDIRHFTATELKDEPMRKELRSYTILADLSDENSPTTMMVKKDLGSEKFNAALEKQAPGNSVGANKWANGQILFYLYGSDNKSLAEAVKTSFPAVAKRVNKHDEKGILASIYGVERSHLGLSKKLQDLYGLDLDVPGSFQEAIYDEENNFVWLRKDDNDSSLSFFFQKIPYTSTDQLDKANLIKIRNELGKAYVTTDTEGDIMVVNDRNLPVYEYQSEIDGFYVKELRGVWEMSKDFFGGPFASYAIVKDLDKEIIFIDAFIYAPGKEKKYYMQQMDMIVKKSKIIGKRASE